MGISTGVEHDHAIPCMQTVPSVYSPVRTKARSLGYLVLINQGPQSLRHRARLRWQQLLVGCETLIVSAWEVVEWRRIYPLE